MSTSVYVLSCSLSSLGGLVLGLILGSLAKGTSRLREFFNSSVFIGILVVLVGAGSTAMYALQGQHLSRVAGCQFQANNMLRAGISARSSAQSLQIGYALAQNEAQLQLLSTPAQADRAVSTKALNTYLTALQQNTAALRSLQATQQQHPLTPLTCEAP